MSNKNVRAVSAWEGPVVRAHSSTASQARPRVMAKKPGHVRGGGRQRAHHAHLDADLLAPSPGALPTWFTGQVSLWLWFTVIFANFAEALAEGRGKAQAAALRGLRQETVARRRVGEREEKVPASALRKGDEVVVEAGQIIPGDGEVIEGIASVDESAVTGESAPVIRESGGDRSAVTGHQGALDRIVVRITPIPASRSSTASSAWSRGRSARRRPTR